MKPLKFAEPLPQKVLSGDKDTTWRIEDEKEITVSDKISLQNTKGEEFGKAKVLWTKNTTFERLSEEDRQGHETFESEEEMLETYSKYYNMKVDSETQLKIIKFELIK